MPKGKPIPDLTARQIARFWAKVDKTSDPEGCWWWTGDARHERGYAMFCTSPKRVSRNLLAHRVAYFLTLGQQPPADKVLHHACNNGPEGCVRPDHLVPITDRDNVMLGNGACAQNARKTHCPTGHPYSPENTRWATDKKGRRSRQCRACNFDRHRALTNASRAARGLPPMELVVRTPKPKGLGQRADRTQCINGHEWTEANTRYDQRSDGVHRACRQCGRERRAARRAVVLAQAA